MEVVNRLQNRKPPTYKTGNLQVVTATTLKCRSPFPQLKPKIWTWAEGDVRPIFLPVLKTSDPDLSSLIETVILSTTYMYMYNTLKKATHFSRYKVPCGDMSVTDMLVNLPSAARFPSCMWICVKRPKALTLAMGYLVLLNVRVKADTWNFTSVLMLSFSVCSVPF